MRVVLMMCVALLFFCGCNTQKRDIKRLDSYFVQYGAESARLSNLIYPCFTGKAKSSDTILIRGRVDTIQGETKSIISISHDTIYKTIFKTMYIDRPFTKLVHDTVVNQRALVNYSYQTKIKSDSLVLVRQNLKDVATGKKNWMLIAIGCMALIIIFVVAKVVLFINGGMVKKMI